MVYVDYYENILIIALIIGITCITYLYTIYYGQPIYEGARSWYRHRGCTIIRPSFCSNSIKKDIVNRDYYKKSVVNATYYKQTDVNRDYILNTKVNEKYIEKTIYNGINTPIINIKTKIDDIKNNILFYKDAEATPVKMNIAMVPTVTTDVNGNATDISFNDKYYVTFDVAPTCLKTKNNYVLNNFKRGETTTHTFNTIKNNSTPNCNFGFNLDKGPYEMIITKP